MANQYSFDVQEVEYLSHNGKPLVAKLYRPRGQGPFPAVIDVHGGAWCNLDRHSDTYLGETLAQAGIVVASVDFRMPPWASYPGSLADINFAIRWLKSHAAEFATRAERVGIFGVSSGGHQAMLLGMLPKEPRYSAIPNPAGAPAVDATVCCVSLFCPVISPLGRYRYAKKIKEGGKPYPDYIDNVLPAHHKYWITEEAMADGDPVLVLERGEKIATPPVLYLQSGIDLVHPEADRHRFVQGYRKAGGELTLEVFEGQADRFLRDYPKTEASVRAMNMLIEFIQRY